MSSPKLASCRKQEPSETDYSPRTGLFLGSEGGGHRRGEWVKQTICVWFHLPDFICQCYRGLLSKKCNNLNDPTFKMFVFEFVIKPSFSIIQLSIIRKNEIVVLGPLVSNIYLELC